MAIEKQVVLSVIDPTRTSQWALERAISMAEDDENLEVVAFLCAASEYVSDAEDEHREAVIRRHALWLKEITSNFDSRGVDIKSEIVWDPDWVEALSGAAERLGADTVVKRGSQRSKSLTSSDKRLLRSLHCNLILVRRESTNQIRTVLLAIDFNADDAEHATLNNLLIELGGRVRSKYPDLELHCVCAHPEAEEFVDPLTVAEVLKIDRALVHVRRGNAAEVIPETTGKIDADLLAIGHAGRTGLARFRHENTAEKILASVDSDLLILSVG